MTEELQRKAKTIKLLKIAEKNIRWRKAVEDILNDDDVIISSEKPDLSGWGVIPRMKTTWKQVKALAEQLSEEE
jgi:hypothetical protein